MFSTLGQSGKGMTGYRKCHGQSASSLLQLSRAVQCWTHGRKFLITGTAGRWEARIGLPGNKHVYLGQFNDEAEAARASDAALVRLRGNAAFTNFALSEYSSDLAARQHVRQVFPINAAIAFKRLPVRNSGL